MKRVVKVYQEFKIVIQILCYGGTEDFIEFTDLNHLEIHSKKLWIISAPCEKNRPLIYIFTCRVGKAQQTLNKKSGLEGKSGVK